MAKYTIRIKEILENYYILKCNNENTNNFEEYSFSENNSEKWNNPFSKKYENYDTPFQTKIPNADEIIENTWKNIFDFEYPKIPDYAIGELEKVILKAYYMREIGLETIERFKLALNQTLNRIMPYYIDLYESIKLQGDNPLENYDLIDYSKRQTNNTNTNITNTEQTSTANNKTVFEDTPSNELGAGTNYATNVNKGEGSSTDNGSSNSNGTNNTTDVYDRHAHGIMGYSKQDLILRYRENLININELIIMELRDLFMLLY